MIGPAALLTGGIPPEPFRHYPDGDVYDHASRSQFYFHTHRAGEQGHFHLFLRPQGLPLCHLVAVGLDDRGQAAELFTTNRWVTGEAWQPAAMLAHLLPSFGIEVPGPAGDVGRWLTGLVAQHAGLIVRLAEERDAAVAQWSLTHPDADPLEARELDILSRSRI